MRRNEMICLAEIPVMMALLWATAWFVAQQQLLMVGGTVLVFGIVFWHFTRNLRE